MYKCLLLLVTVIGAGITASAQKQTLKQLKQSIETAFSLQPGVFALAFKDLQTNQSIYIREHETFHAASIMKTPVLIEAYRQAAAGKLSLSDSIPIVNKFNSIADSSQFVLDAADDSEFELYKKTGEKATLYDLLYLMITSSSNLATNIVIEKLGAVNVDSGFRSIGALDSKILRGVEDGKAYAKGMNNIVSAYDVALLFEKMARKDLVNEAAAGEMIHILMDQQFRDIIPAKLPAAVKVAHKTGFIKGIHHDSGIVFLPDGRKYVLVLLSKNLVDDAAGIETMAGVSEKIYKYMYENKNYW